MAQLNLFVILLSALLAGCGTTPQKKLADKPTVPRGASAVVETKSLPGVPAEVSEKQELAAALTSFPTSKNSAKGKAWKEMGLFPFQGTVDEAVSEMPISGVEKNKFKEMFSSGRCERYEIKNGEKFTVDWLNFSVKDGKGVRHSNRQSVEADLKVLPSKMVTVCHLGGGVYAGQFDGCKNFWVSYSELPKMAEAQTRPMCPDGRRVILHVWSDKSFPVDVKKLADDLTEKEMNQKESFTRGSTLSRTLGRTLRVRSNKGEFSRSTEPTKVSTSLIRVGEANVGVGEFEVKSTHVFSFPEEIIKERTVSMVFSDEAILSPPIGRNGLRELRMPWSEWTDCTMNMHAVRR